MFNEPAAVQLTPLSIISEYGIARQSDLRTRTDQQKTSSVVVSFEQAILERAVRGGLHYEKRGCREIAACAAWLNPEIVEIVRRFRGRSYAEKGPVDAVKNGLNEHPDDPESYHVLLIERGILLGCARYCRRVKAVDLGGWVVARNLRGTRATLEIINTTRTLAKSLGDTAFIAQASMEYGSASVLRKLGGHVLSTYWDPAYQRHVETIQIVLPTSERRAA